MKKRKKLILERFKRILFYGN